MLTKDVNIENRKLTQDMNEINQIFKKIKDELNYVPVNGKEINSSRFNMAKEDGDGVLQVIKDFKKEKEAF